jgi:hypothetical protein
MDRSKHWPIDTKAKFVRLYKAGEFGNAAPTWYSLDSMEDGGVLEDSVPWQKFHIRNKAPGGPTWYNVSIEDLADTWYGCVGLYGTEGLYISAMAPHWEHGTIQGEVRRSVEHLDLTLAATGLVPMRDALELGSNLVHGIEAVTTLRHYMDVNSYEWLQYLLDVYPDHVIEFSCFDRYWGTVPRRNTVFWEVRYDRPLCSSISRFTEVY